MSAATEMFDPEKVERLTDGAGSGEYIYGPNECYVWAKDYDNLLALYLELKSPSIPPIAGRVIDAKGQPLSATMMRELSTWIESDKWKVVMSPYTSVAYEAAAEVVKVNFYRPTFQGNAADCEAPEPHLDTKFASIREDLFFPRDQVWLVDENFYIAGTIANLMVPHE